MGVEIPDAAARIVWEALRDHLAAAAATNGGGGLHPDARALLDALRAAAWRHHTGLSATGQPARPGGHDGPDASPAATEVTTSVAAARLGVSARTVRRLAATGRLPARRHGRAWAIHLDPEDAHDRPDTHPSHHPGPHRR